ncbi:MAG: hypothetical protein ACRCUP_06415 [Mycoplasmatales bacterium]
MFNHYAKLKRILDDYEEWYIIRIDKPTSTTRFDGEQNHYEYYYRLYANGKPIKYGKFQQLSKLAQVLKVSEDELILKIKK